MSAPPTLAVIALISALLALISALLVVPSAGAATPAPDVVQQTVGSVKTATGGVSAMVDRTTSQVAQPVTAAVAQTTSRTTEAITSGVEETVSRATRRLQPTVDNVAGAADGVTRQASAPGAATVSSSPAQPQAPPATAPDTREPSTGQGPARRHDRRPELETERSQGHPAGAMQVRESGDRTEPGRAVAAVAPLAPPARPRTARGSASMVEHAKGAGSDVQYPDLPAPASGSASSMSTGLALGSLALLAAALCLTLPGLLRRLPAAPVTRRPVAFSYALERPG